MLCVRCCMGLPMGLWGQWSLEGDMLLWGPRRLQCVASDKSAFKTYHTSTRCCCSHTAAENSLTDIWDICIVFCVLVLWIWMADPHTVHIFSLSCTLCDWCCHWHASSVFKCICTEVLSHFGLNWYNTISEDGYRFHFFVIHSIWSVSRMWFLCCQILCHSFHRYRAGRDNYPAGIQVEAEVPSIPSTLKAFCNK